MIQPIMKDVDFLAIPSEEATAADLPVAKDLLDTLRAHRHECVGMAANMIGVSKRIIAFDDEGKYEVMLNPQIVYTFGAYETEEGCLSLEGKRPTKRFRSIKVEYQDMKLAKHKRSFTGWTAQIIQHEVDHLSGIII